MMRFQRKITDELDELDEYIYSDVCMRSFNHSVPIYH